MNFEQKFKVNKGITLIALVVTIIVLLILAGISISMLTGQNGILNRASEAQEKTGTAQADELVKLSVTEALTQGLGELTDVNLKTALNNNIGEGKYEITGDAENGWTVTVNGKKYKIDSTGKISGNTGSLPKGEGTTPYLPDASFSYKEGDLNTGLVVEDEDENEYVWVEVPTTIYENEDYNEEGDVKPSSSTDYDNIVTCLNNYASDYGGYQNPASEYETLYNSMLKSIYENGGFWVARYEAGIDENRGEDISGTEAPSIAPVSKINMYPYNRVTQSQAQMLATKLNYENCTSSLMFDIQWNLILKYIENKNVATKETLTNDSKSIGNYMSSYFTSSGNITNNLAKYSVDFGNNFRNCPCERSGRILLTTGADKSFSLMNIYDLAGNVSEFVLDSCSRGGSCDRGNTASCSEESEIDRIGYAIGFRVSLWK